MNNKLKVNIDSFVRLNELKRSVCLKILLELEESGPAYGSNIAANTMERAEYVSGACAILLKAGLIKYVQHGRFRLFSIVPEKMEEFKSVLTSIDNFFNQ